MGRHMNIMHGDEPWVKDSTEKGYLLQVRFEPFVHAKLTLLRAMAAYVPAFSQQVRTFEG